MASTTQILFNSPALHSLKRDQLVKLCKIHSIKASGKNVDLIQKLKQHAQTLPKDDPLSIAVRGESNENEEEEQEDKEEDTCDSVAHDPDSSPVPSLERRGSVMPRVSEGWEVVMDSIAEEDENASSQGTITSMKTVGGGKAGEFGTGSSKSSTVGSSIRALANSLGLKKSATAKSTVSSHKSNISTKSAATVATRKDELEENSTPYASLPPAEPVEGTQPLAFNPSRMSMNGFLAEGETPLPGHALRPGQPAPSNARLSMGLGLGGPVTPSRPTTTIRLVSNRPVESSNSAFLGTPQLKPFKTSFDLIIGSPGPASPAPTGLYPTLTFSDLPPTLPSGEGTMEGIVNTPHLKPPASNAADKTPDPFVFGSPLPQHRVSDAQFKTAAASVLEEMNKRLQEQGVDGVDTTIIGRLHPGASSKAELESRPTAPLPRPRAELKEKFDQAHQQEFQKMEGIDEYMKRRTDRGLDTVPIAGKKRKSSVLAPADVPINRRPIGAPRPSGTRVVSKGKHPRAIPGAFGLDDDDGDEEEESEELTERAGKRIRVVSDASTSNEGEDSKALTEAEQEEKRTAQEKERQAIRRKLEMNKAKRRSSAANGGLHGRRSGRLSGRVSIGLASKPKPSRFGFLSSAKNLVQSVWNRGKPANPAVATSSAIPKAKSNQAAEKASGPNRLVKKPTVVKPSTTMATASSSRVAPETKSTESNLTRPTAASSARARSPIPSFGAQSIRGSIASNPAGTQTSRSSTTGATGTSRKQSAVGTGTSRVSSAHVSSVGTRLSSARMSSTGTLGSMGTKKSSLTPGSRPSNAGTSSSRLSTSSRLFAPTASSLAKTHRSSVAGLKPVAERPPSSLPVRSPPASLRSPPVSSIKSDAISSVLSPPTISKSGDALNTITNRPTTTPRRPEPFSPTRGKIFSTPLEMPSGIPTPVVKNAPATGFSIANGGAENGPKAPATGVTRQRSLNGRKPRISRSKVIARLASQRAASGSSTVSTIITPKPGSKPRSSLGAKVKRSSLGGAKLRVSGGGDALMSAKKRARQSEYHMRRRSRIEALTLSPQKNAMDVDE